MDMYVNASALSAFGSGMQVIGHNIANISTRDFEPQTYVYRSGPGDQGVEFVPKSGFDPSGEPTNYPDPSLGFQTDYINNGVDLPRQMVDMITTQHAYTANAHTISAMEDTSGVLLDMVV